MTTVADVPKRTGSEVKVPQWLHLIPIIGLIIIAALTSVGGISEGGSHSIDDLVVCVLALGGIVWLVPGANRRSRSLIPLWLVSGALIMKLIGIAIEHGDKGDVGDDIFAVLLIALVLVVSGLVYFLTRPSSNAT